MKTWHLVAAELCDEPDMNELVARHETVIHNAAISACCDIVLKQIRRDGRESVKAALDVLHWKMMGLKR